MGEVHDPLVIQKENSKDHLKALIAEATLKYSIKDYDSAAELYSQATELQADLNGELSSENADLLYSYGRCLYHVAVRNSDVLGSKVAAEKREEGSKKINNQNRDRNDKSNGSVDKEGIEEKGKIDKAERKITSESKPYFQFTGDDNFDDSGTDDEDDGVDGKRSDEVGEEVEDDFMNAYEILDLARVLLLKRIKEAREVEEKPETTGGSQNERLEERLADTHDLLAEISLEGEKFLSAVVDSKAALELKQKLFPLESSLIAEAHYKLSLALEFSSMMQQKDAATDVEEEAPTTFDEAMREEAAKEMEAAIASCNSRIEKEEARLGAYSTQNHTDEKPKVTRENIDDVKEMVNDMEQRLVELRQHPISINDATGTGDAHPLTGILGSILGESPAAQNSRLEEASKSAVDLTKFVKRKKPASNDELEAPVNLIPAKSNGKRRVEFADEIIDVRTEKKAKLSGGDED